MISKSIFRVETQNVKRTKIWKRKVFTCFGMNFLRYAVENQSKDVFGAISAIVLGVLIMSVNV